MIDAMRLDSRYALRTIAKAPAFSSLFVLILALGIGANSAMFSIVDAVLFRPLPAIHPEQLVRIFGYDEKQNQTFSISFPAYQDYRDESKSFVHTAGYSEWNDVNVSTEKKKAERVNAAIVTGNYFGLLGARPYRGRLIGPSDDGAKGQHPVVVISNHFWKTYFNSAEDISGKTIRINGTLFSVIGVASPGFRGTGLEHIPELWMPMAMVDVFLPEFAAMKPLEERRLGWLDAIARLKPGVSLDQAQAELRVIAAREDAKDSKAHRHFSVKLVPAQNAMIDLDGTNSVSKISWLLLGATFLVLMIAIVVASGLLLVRAEQRQKEIAVRLAIGASRFQIIRQLMLESLMITAFAAVAGLIFALWCTDLLAGAVGNQGFTLPVGAATPLLSTRVLIATVFLSCFSATLFGLIPALLSSRSTLLPALKNESVDVSRSRVFSLKNVFIVVQVAFCILLMTGAGLLLRTLWKTRAVNPGFDPGHAVVASVDLAKQGYSKEQGKIFYQTMLQKLRSIPGLRRTALARAVPVQPESMVLTFDDIGLSTDLNVISPGFFKTLNVPILQGRDFQSSDTEHSLQVGIANEAMARRFWPNQQAIGKVLKDVGGESKSVQIVGVVPDVKFKSLQTSADPMLFVPLSQWHMQGMTILVRSSLAPQATLLQLQRAMEQIDKNLPLYGMKTLDQKIEQSLIQERVLAGLLAIFGGIALLLAAVGLYSLLSFITETRTREIGIRMAIGAKRADVLRTFLDRGLGLTAAGIALGVVISMAASRVLENLLFAVTRFDAWTYAGITLVMIATAFAASFFPARKAANLDPVKALRYE